MRRSVQLTTLHCALVVADEGSFLAGSRRLGIHHSALSRRVRDLELTLGVALFDRHPGGIRPTMAGERFLANLRRVLMELDGTLSLIETARHGKIGRLSIGIDAPLPASGHLDAVTAFVRGRPDIAIQFTENRRAELYAGLSGKTIDVVIAHGFDRREPDTSLPLWRDRIIVAMAADHPLAGQDVVDWGELGGQTMLTNMQSIDMTLVPGMAPSGDLPSMDRHDVSRMSLLSLVRHGLGMTLLPESDTLYFSEGVVASVLQRQGRSVRVRYDAHWRPDNSNPVLAAFIDFLKERYSRS